MYPVAEPDKRPNITAVLQMVLLKPAPAPANTLSLQQTTAFIIHDTKRSSLLINGGSEPSTLSLFLTLLCRGNDVSDEAGPGFTCSDGGPEMASGQAKTIEKPSLADHSFQLQRLCGMEVAMVAETQIFELAALDRALVDSATLRNVLAARLDALRQVKQLWPVATLTHVPRPTALRPALAAAVARRSAVAAMKRAAAASDCAVLGDLLLAAASPSGVCRRLATHLDLETFAALLVPDALPRLVSNGGVRYQGAGLHTLLVLLNRLGPLIAMTVTATRSATDFPWPVASSDGTEIEYGSDVTLEEFRMRCEAVAAGLSKMLTVLASSYCDICWVPLARMCTYQIRDVLCLLPANSQASKGAAAEFGSICTSDPAQAAWKLSPQQENAAAHSVSESSRDLLLERKVEGVLTMPKGPAEASLVLEGKVEEAIIRPKGLAEAKCWKDTSYKPSSHFSATSTLDRDSSCPQSQSLRLSSNGVGSPGRRNELSRRPGTREQLGTTVLKK